MADEELIQAGLDALEGLIGVLIEDAPDEAVGMAPDHPTARRARIRRLQQVGSDVVALTQACEVLLRWRLHTKSA